MNKKFLSAILFGALMVTSTGTFVSCKDYDEDIDSINKELTDIKSQLAALQSKVDAGKWITSVSSTANGVAITMSDGQTLNITNGKDGQNGADGAQGEAGKDGTVVTVVDGVLCLDGVATEIKVAQEAPAALPCVKVEDGVLMVLGEDGKYAATDIKTSGVTATNTNGVWTITVGEDKIVVPGSAALTSIAIQGENTLVYNYGYFAEDVEWGFNKEEKAEAGFYSRLKEDVNVLLNPAEADGAAFTYTFRNSVKAIEGITFFDEARPSTAVLTRAASPNGVWTLPAAVTKHDATSISELRNELYLNFKQNDKEYYAMSLEAIDGLGNVSTRSDYEYKITLDQASNTVTVAGMNCLVGQEYYPVVDGAVIDYKIQVYPSVTDKRKAEAFGIEIVDNKGFIATKDAAVFNDIKFQVAYVTINGVAKTTSFIADFANELTSSDEVRVDEQKVALNAALAFDPLYKYYRPAAEIVARFMKGNELLEKNKTFVIDLDYDLTKLYDGLSEEAKMILDEGFGANAELIGGEGSGYENYNELDRNAQLMKNIKWSYSKTTKTINVRLYVSAHWPTAYGHKEETFKEETGLSWIEYSNFQLNTAYQLNLSVTDDLNGTEVAKFELPFELTQPEIDVVGVDRNTEGSFSVWGNHNEWWGPTYHHCDVLYMFGAYDEEKFYMPMYDAFNIWTKAPYADKNLNPNAEYYKLNCVSDYKLDGKTSEITMDDIEYEGAWNKYPANLTWTSNKSIESAVKNQDDKTKGIHDKEAWTYVKTEFDFYGVYPATKNQLGYYGEQYSNGYNTYVAGFRLVFASTIQKSTIEMDKEVYSATAGTNQVFISNDNITATTMLGGDFVLFDGLVNGKVVTRENLNDARGFNEGQRPFVAASKYEISAKYANGDEEDVIDVITNMDGDWTLEDGKYIAKPKAFDPSSIKVFLMPAKAETPATDTAEKIEGKNQGLLIVLGDNIEDNQPIEISIKVKDTMGFYNEFKVIAKKL